MPSSFYEFDVLWTPLAPLIEGPVLALRAQPGVGLASPWCLTFSDVLRAGFAM